MNDEFDRWVSDKPRYYTTSQMALMRNAFVAGQQATTEKLSTLPHRLMYESGINAAIKQAKVEGYVQGYEDGFTDGGQDTYLSSYKEPK